MTAPQVNTARIITTEGGVKCLTGHAFPDPDPTGTVFNQGSTTMSYTIPLASIGGLVGMRYGDATNQNNIVPCTNIISVNGNMICTAFEDHDTLAALLYGWTPPQGS